MKKLLLVFAIALTSLSANAQDGSFNLGANLLYSFKAESFGLMAEANYLFEVSDQFKVGPAVAYSYAFGKDIEVNGITIKGKGTGSFIVAGAGRVDLSDEFVLGADLGYHTDAKDFYYRPLIGYKLNEKSTLQLSYPGVGSSGSLGLGVLFSL